ncbi:LysR family transcriptional regulator [Shewanella yunxiaonensis]|uniref:LysR family transcriptional regulator n=1 Tax=Shewanella yunxiaonensis TaxID=2829809 RepID=A0ABX7YVG2_9GAMM|nr:MULTISPECIES: LysR family transcriptional regulator [Shewanella]MDF0532788.1 LysR family transcriptional regulator [Shewanella sp. A32]QUN06674.1 LysR family transcriptional regulator [Shewanella yunxiaonensis]
MLELLEPIAIFTHVARAGSFSAAARRLGISKSKVSTQVADLEHKLGVQLIQRTTRSLSLTEAGNLLYTQGEELLRGADQAVASVHNLNDATRGVLKLGISQSFGTAHIIPALPEFMSRHPELELQVSLLDHKVDVVSEGLDLLLTMSEQLPLGMVARPLMKCQFMLLASPAYIANHGKPSRPEQLVEHNCLVYHGEWHEHSVWQFKRGDDYCEIGVNGNFRVDNAPALKSAAVSGLGIVYMATYLLENEIEEGKLVPLLPEWHLVHHLPLQAVYPRRKHLAPKVSAFIDFIKNHIGTPPIWDEKYADIFAKRQ